MLAAIHELAEKKNDPSIYATEDYLRACNKLFENGILSHEKISSITSPVLANIHEGYMFFKDWHRQLIEANIGIL